MEDWNLRENNESPVGVNNFVDNMHLLWRLQSLDTLIPPDNETSQSFNEFEQSAPDYNDDEDLVEKLFLESIAMQQQEEEQGETNQGLMLERPFNEKEDDLTSPTPETLAAAPERPETPFDRPQAIQPRLLPAPQNNEYFNPAIHRPMQETTSQPTANHYLQQPTPNHTLPPMADVSSSMLYRQLTGPLPPLSKMTPNSSPMSQSIMPFMRMPIRNPVIPRPQLFIHFKRQEVVDSSFYDDPKDPMKADLDVSSLRRLTVATLRTLGVFISAEELPSVDIDGLLTTDSQQVLPAAAMQLITTMVLGTSCEKDVSRTLGSQISNGDLVALQRMIVAGLRSKKLVIHTVLTDQQLPTPQPSSSSKPLDGVDLSKVKYEPPHNVTRLFLRLYRFIINMLLSTYDCWPFIQPVPTSAFVYHREITEPMDLQTIEENVWTGKYTKFARFEKDIRLIWKNARAFHRNTGTIPKHADYLEKLFNKIVVDIKRQISKKQQQQQQGQQSQPQPTSQPQPQGNSHIFKFDPSDTLPEECDFSYPPLEQVFSESSTVYAIAALSPLEPKGRKFNALNREKQLYLQLNGPFFQAIEDMISDPHSNHSRVPRFYIAKNRTLLRQIRSQGVLAIFYNTKTSRVKSSKLIRIETDIILAYPASDLFDIDLINDCTEEFTPKAWIHLRPLRVLHQRVFEVNEAIERDYFKRMFATSKMALDDKGGLSATKRLLRRVVRQILSLPELEEEPLEETTPVNKRIKFHRVRRKTQEEEAMDVDKGSDDERATPKHDTKSTSDYQQDMSNLQHLGQKEISHDVWQRLLGVCKVKGIIIRNITEHGQIHWNMPNSEGFFKRVYFIKDSVVQVFRQMTMYQRITEVACLMKLRNLPHMAQVREVLYNDNGDITGLSLERYQITLKQYTHVHSHHRLSAYQKYDTIYQMLVCMKTIHEAGLAHRDLSEVNIMVNTVDGQFLEDGSEKVCLYLIDFGKAVFCQPQDVRNWFVDVPRAEWEYDGDVVPETKEELNSWCDSLPWVKGKPDHGYRMYRSIQTLPKTRSDNQVLPWLIHPQSEDIYSIGVMIWKVFTDTEPWRGILDTDLQGLRYVAQDDYRIQRALEGEVHGELSRQLLLKCLRTRPQDRETAKDILDWLGQEQIREGLVGEWKMYSSDTRSTRRAKTFYGFDEDDDDEKRRPRKKANTMNKRGRPKAQKEPYLN